MPKDTKDTKAAAKTTGDDKGGKAAKGKDTKPADTKETKPADTGKKAEKGKKK